jgi:type IV pilus assembly protein PilB
MKFVQERPLIGEILVERGVLTPEALATALEHQRRSPKEFIGTILIRLGLLAEIDVVTALVLQCNLPYISISDHRIDPGVLRLIPADMACRSRLVPLDRIGSVLSVVMANPIDADLRAEVERVTGCHVAVFISTSAQINGALGQYYGLKGS